MRFLRLSAALMLSALAAAPLHAQAGGEMVPPRSPRNANYSIDARLDPATRTITARETITWRNITMAAVDDLRFHVYWNAWRDERSTWQRERKLTGAASRDSRPGDWARVDVTSIRLTGADAADLTSRLRFIAPDDDNGEDRTVLQAPLPNPVRPGQALTMTVEWTAHVPRPFARTGAIGSYFFIAQWFPKLGVLEDGGWNCHQFHSSTEFFSDYGVYDVRLTTPRGWPVGATGVERERRDNPDNTTTHRFYQEDVHDFAWTTSPDSLERTARFEHPTLPAVAMRLLLRPDHAGQAERHFEATRAALKYYGEWFGAYPYGHITIVDPAFQSASGAMEYPTLFTAESRRFAPQHSDDPEDVVVHEAGHQFFYGIVGNNEFEDAWMDEGLNTFAEARVMDTWYPTWHQERYFGTFIPYVFKEIPLTREADWDRLAGYRRYAKIDAQATPSYRYYPGPGSAITYNKTALWLHTLERWLGWPVVQRILATYFTRWQFRHPKPADFFSIANEVSGRDLTPFFDQVYDGSNVFDYGIQELRSEREGDFYRTNVVVRRYGEAVFPIDVRVTFTGGAPVVEHWDGKDRWHLYTYSRPERAVSAVADPERVLLLDVNVTNNSKSLEAANQTNARAATKWSLDWMVWLQNCMLSWGLLI
jgi:hypothetical protein